MTNWQSLTGYLYFMAVCFMFIEMTPVSVVFPLERPIFLKEESFKLYSTLSYFASRSLIEVPYILGQTLIIQLVTYWSVNLSSTPQQLFTFSIIAFLLGLAGSSTGLLIGSLISDAKTSETVTNIIFRPMFLFAGFFKHRANFPVWIGWIEYLSPVKFGFTAFLENEVSNSVTSNVHEMNFDVGLWQSIRYIALLSLGYRCLSLLLLWTSRTRLQ